MLPGLSNLTEVHVRAHETIEALPFLPKLQPLLIEGTYSEFVDFAGIELPPSLRDLRVTAPVGLYGRHLFNLWRLAGLTGLTGLTTLRFDMRTPVTETGFLTCLSCLRELSFPAGPMMMSLAVLPRLTYLSLNDCYEMSNVSALSSLSALESLVLSSCPRIVDLSALSLLSRLTSLRLTWVSAIETVAFSALTGLVELTVFPRVDSESDFAGIDLSMLSRLTSLEICGISSLALVSPPPGLCGH